MSKTLNLVDRLLENGRRLQALGRSQDALQIFSRLSGFKSLTSGVAEEASARAAEIHLAQRRFKKARRHLTAAIAQQPNSARYHFLMATALDLDEDGDLVRAYDHYKKSLELDPEQPRCLGDFGLVAMCLGEVEEGLQALRKAVELAPDDPEVVAELVEGLCEAGQPDEARAALRAARFRNPRDSRFLKLWNDFQFQQLREAQDAERQAVVNRDAVNARMILPFVRPAPGATPAAPRKRYRRDGASPPRPPHVPRSTDVPGRRHA
jgi:tetratricopeptide (TPR) repeat protein